MWRDINKFLLFTIVGFLIYATASAVLVWYRYQSLTERSSEALDDLAISHISNLLFFILVGAVGVAAQFFGERGDVLRERLRKMFASKSVSYPVLEYFEDVVRSTCVFAQLASHKITVLEYNSQLHAYRGGFHNVYFLRNAFGDVPYDAELSVEIAPDMIRDNVFPLAFISELSITTPDGKKTRYIKGGREIDRMGFKQPIRITLPPNGTAKFEMSWWSWIEVGGESGFSQKRFSEHFLVQVENRSVVTPMLYMEGDTQYGVLPYGQTETIADLRNHAPRVRVGFFWGPPVEYAHLGTGAAGRDDATRRILDFERRVGERQELKF